MYHDSFAYFFTHCYKGIFVFSRVFRAFRFIFYLYLAFYNIHLLMSAGSGGGSGGSVWISTNFFRGHGEITSRGGLGNNYAFGLGGSGAGGRIAVHMNKEDEFRGTYSPFGGAGDGSRQGGSGTVYVEEIRQHHIHSRLYIDNRNAMPVKEFVLKERNPRKEYHKRVDVVEPDYHIDELMLLNEVSKTIYVTFLKRLERVNLTFNEVLKMYRVIDV